MAREFIRNFPTDYSVQMLLAKTLFNGGAFHESLLIYNSILNEFPSHVVAKYNRCIVLKRMNGVALTCDNDRFFLEFDKAKKAAVFNDECFNFTYSFIDEILNESC